MSMTDPGDATMQTNGRLWCAHAVKRVLAWHAKRAHPGRARAEMAADEEDWTSDIGELKDDAPADELQRSS